MGFRQEPLSAAPGSGRPGAYASLCWEDVAEGQELPGFDYELSLLRLVAFTRATGLYEPVHFDGEFARSQGIPDAFIATGHLASLFNRLISDWTGPGSQLVAMTFSMTTLMLRGDMLRLSGRVGRKYRSAEGNCLVDLVDLTVKTDRAPVAARASATIVMPSREGGHPPITRPRPAPEAAAAADDWPDFARAMLGEVKPGKGLPESPLSAQEVYLWCEAIEDWNPLYWDDAYAASTPYGRLIAPPCGSFNGIGTALDAGIGYRKPGVQVPEPITQGLTGFALSAALRNRISARALPFVPPGCPDLVIARAELRFYAPHYVGDPLASSLRLTGCSPKRSTRLGEGYFVTVENALTNPRGELVKTNTLTGFYY